MEVKEKQTIIKQTGEMISIISPQHPDFKDNVIPTLQILHLNNELFNDLKKAMDTWFNTKDFKKNYLKKFEEK